MAQSHDLCNPKLRVLNVVCNDDIHTISLEYCRYCTGCEFYTLGFCSLYQKDLVRNATPPRLIECTSSEVK